MKLKGRKTGTGSRRVTTGPNWQSLAVRYQIVSSHLSRSGSALLTYHHSSFESSNLWGLAIAAMMQSAMLFGPLLTWSNVLLPFLDSW